MSKTTGRKPVKKAAQAKSTPFDLPPQTEPQNESTWWIRENDELRERLEEANDYAKRLQRLRERRDCGRDRISQLHCELETLLKHQDKLTIEHDGVASIVSKLALHL